MANPTTGWDPVPIFGFYFKGDGITPVSGKVKATMTQRVTRVDGRVIYPEGATVERTIGEHEADAAIRDAVRDAWRDADEAAAIAASGVFDAAAWNTWWNVMLTGAVFFGFPASDDPNIVETGYQVLITENLTGGKMYPVAPVLADLDITPPGINLGLVDVPPGSPSDPLPIYQKGMPGGVASLDGTGLVPVEQLPDLGGGAVESVNGYTGVVVIGASDVGAYPTATVDSLVGGRQPLDSDLTAIAALSTTTYGRGLLVQSSAEVARTTLGLGNVDNTADSAKPVSTAQQTAIDAAKARANHTGTQTSATISDFTEAVQDAVAALLGAGSNITLTYDDAANTLTVTGTGGGTTDPEAVRDAIGVALVGVGNISIAVDDAGDTITISTTATVNSTDVALRDRSTHTGEQAIATVTGLQGALDAKAATASLAEVATATDTDAAVDGTFLGRQGGVWTAVAAPGQTTDASALTSGLLDIERQTPGAEIVVDYNKAVYGAADAWPASRPTARTDLVIKWMGPTDPGMVAIAGDIVYLTA